MGFTAEIILRTLQDPEKTTALVLRHQDTLKFWGSLVGLAVCIFFLFSDGDFSFLLTLSSLVSMSAFVVVLLRIEAEKTVKGVSLRMMECYMCVCLGRLCAIVPFEGYLPADRSGDWLYQALEALTFCLASAVVYMCRFRYPKTYDPLCDTWNHVLLILPSAVLAVLFHPSLNAFMPSDVCWAFALYLESVAVLPQLFMFQKTGQVEKWTAHFLGAQALAKLISFVFWATSYTELHGDHEDHAHETDLIPHSHSYVGNWVMVMQLVQICLMGDFIYHYARCLRQGIPLNLLLCADNV